MRVLITGAGGFIGSHLVDSQLKCGNDVRAVDLHVERLKHVAGQPHLDIIRGDITNSELLKEIIQGVDVVYHLASAHLDVSLSDEHYRKVNVGATTDLLKSSLQAGVKRFIHVSSVGVIGDVKNPPADETSPCAPTNIYERTKLEGEQAALEFARQTGFPVIVLRPAWVYGPRCPRTEKLIRTIAKGRFLFFGEGKNLRHPVYIADAIRGLELSAAADDLIGEVFIIAGNEPVRVLDLVHVICQELGVNPPKFKLPVTLGVLGGIGIETIYKPSRRQPPFSRRSLDFFLKDNAYNISKARNYLDYQPQVDLSTGIQNTVSFYNGSS
jgi:nucleoside-diphosphate-sugar epimerase